MNGFAFALVFGAALLVGILAVAEISSRRLARRRKP
jgi:hypothetical protein